MLIVVLFNVWYIVAYSTCFIALFCILISCFVSSVLKRYCENFVSKTKCSQPKVCTFVSSYQPTVNNDDYQSESTESTTPVFCLSQSLFSNGLCHVEMACLHPQQHLACHDAEISSSNYIIFCVAILSTYHKDNDDHNVLRRWFYNTLWWVLPGRQRAELRPKAPLVQKYTLSIWCNNLNLKLVI